MRNLINAILLNLLALCIAFSQERQAKAVAAYVDGLLDIESEQVFAVSYQDKAAFKKAFGITEVQSWAATLLGGRCVSFVDYDEKSKELVFKDKGIVLNEVQYKIPSPEDRRYKPLIGYQKNSAGLWLLFIKKLPDQVIVDEGLMSHLDPKIEPDRMLLKTGPKINPLAFLQENHFTKEQISKIFSLTGNCAAFFLPYGVDRFQGDPPVRLKIAPINASEYLGIIDGPFLEDLGVIEKRTILRILSQVSDKQELAKKMDELHSKVKSDFGHLVLNELLTRASSFEEKDFDALVRDKK